MPRNRQISLPLGPLPTVMELVGGHAVYHLRAVGATRTFCKRAVPNPLGEKMRRLGWGKIPLDLRCSQCDRRLQAMRKARRV